MSWQNVVKPLEARFPRSQVRVLAYKTHGMLTALLAAYGLPADQADAAGNVLKNRGWSDPAMQIAALAMPKLDGSERDRLRALLDDLTQDHPLPSFQVLDDSLKPRLQVQYADDLVALRAESA
jgi:hypothetical protein